MVSRGMLITVAFERSAEMCTTISTSALPFPVCTPVVEQPPPSLQSVALLRASLPITRRLIGVRPKASAFSLPPAPSSIAMLLMLPFRCS